MKKVLAIFTMLVLWGADAKANANAEGRYFDVGTWYFGLSAGTGTMQNPLHEQEDIPLSILPDIRYYGEKLSIENLSVSYALLEKPNFVLEVIGEQNQDGTYFPGSLRSEYAAFVGPHHASPLDLWPNDREPEKPSPRSMSYMSGVELRYYNWVNAFITLATDVSNLHHGNALRLELQKDFSIANVQFSSSVSLIHKDKKLIDYYYSFDERDTNIPTDFYYAGAATNFFFQLNAAYPVTPHFAFVAAYNKTWLDDTIVNSPIVVRGQITATFLGVKYAF